MGGGIYLNKMSPVLSANGFKDFIASSFVYPTHDLMLYILSLDFQTFILCFMTWCLDVVDRIRIFTINFATRINPFGYKYKCKGNHRTKKINSPFVR
jgi:hypothetical protein